MKISIIVAAAENDVIGRNNRMIWRLSDDMKHFKTLTTGNAIIMGRKTFESLGKALPERKNIVLTHDKNFTAANCTIAHTPEEALQAAYPYNEVFIIGGGELYRLFRNKADKLYLTRVHARPEGDTQIPPISEDYWMEEERTVRKADEKNEYDCTYIVYRKRENH